jgi:hypothetical protein
MVKESRNRPGAAERVPGGVASQISWHSAREGGEVVSLTHRPPLPPGMYLVLIFTRGGVDPRAMERSEGNMSLKNLVTPPGIDPGTVRLVAQRLNHYGTPLHYKIFIVIGTNICIISWNVATCCDQLYGRHQHPRAHKTTIIIANFILGQNKIPVTQRL